MKSSKRKAVIKPVPVKVISLPGAEYRKYTNLVGLHLLNPTDAEIDDASQRAELDMFPAVYCYWDNVVAIKRKAA